MLAQDLMRFGTIYFIFIMGFGQAYFLVFMSYENEEETNPMETAMDSVLQMFIMTLGAFGDIWDEIPFTRHKAIGDYVELERNHLIEIYSLQENSTGFSSLLCWLYCCSIS